MPQLRESYTQLVERNVTWTGDFASETTEAAWASEAIFFVRALKINGDLPAVEASVQISPDGMHWCDEGTTFALPAADDMVTFARVSHFGGWLRIVGNVPTGAEITVIVYLVLKG